MNRREVLKAGAAVSLGALGPTGCVHLGGKAPTNWGIGLYTVRSQMEQDPIWTVTRLARMGYTKLEFFRTGYFGIAPVAWRKILADLGMTTPSRLIRLNHLREDFERTLDEAEVMGHTCLVLSYIHQSERQSMDQYEALFDLFAAAGEAMKARRLRFGYHNHRFEFDQVDGEIPFERMLATVPEELMVLTLDTYHLARAGLNPVDLIAKHRTRVHQLHLKDIGADGLEMLAPGEGVIDFARVLGEFRVSSTRHAYVEHDDESGGMDIAAKAISNLDRIVSEGRFS